MTPRGPNGEKRHLDLEPRPREASPVRRRGLVEG
jgi:hypothetical protein